MNILSLRKSLALSGWFAIVIAFSTFVILGFYVIAGVDDLYVMKKTVDSGFFHANGFVYDTMTGRYISNALMTFCGIFYNDIFGLITCDRFIPIGITLLLPISIYIFIRTISLNQTRTFVALGFSLLFTLVYLTKTPTITEVLYWAASAATHTLGCILMLFLLACLIKQQLQPKPIYTFLAIFLSILLGGVSELALFATLIFIFFGIIFIRFYQGQYNITWIISSLVLILCAYLVSNAHGNIARLIYSPHPADLKAAIAYMSTAPFYFFKSWFNNPLFILTSIFLFFKIPPQSFADLTLFQKINLRILMFSIPVWLLTTLFIPFFTIFLISTPYYRFWNIAYFIFLLGWFLHIALLRILLSNRQFNLTLPTWFNQIYLFFIALALIFNVTYMRAVDDLLIKAKPYDDIFYNRIHYLITTDNEVVAFDPIPHAQLPRIIHRYDLTNAPDCYFNYQYAMIFNKKAIYVKPLDENNCTSSAKILQYANMR